MPNPDPAPRNPKWEGDYIDDGPRLTGRQIVSGIIIVALIVSGVMFWSAL